MPVHVEVNEAGQQLLGLPEQARGTNGVRISVLVRASSSGSGSISIIIRMR